MTSEYYFAWWNLENLFDIRNSPQRAEWLQKKLDKELQGWNTAQLNIKLRQLASVIKAMNAGAGPDLLGVCEVESQAVLEKLVAAIGSMQHNYAIAHADTDDKRGIDIAFIYDTNKFDIELDNLSGESKIFSHKIQKRSPTRDILQVNFVTKSQEPFIVIGNHWPSRTAGELASEPYRMIAGETLAYFMERIKEIRGEIPVLVMGDFNDEPFNRAMTDYALSVSNIKKVTSKRAQNPYLFNMMWPLMDGKQGTHYYDGLWGMLDQVMVNRAGLDTAGLHCRPDEIGIFTMPGMVQRGKIVRHGRPSSQTTYNPEGFSDHLPVYFKVYSTQ